MEKKMSVALLGLVTDTRLVRVGLVVKKRVLLVGLVI